MDGCLIEKRKCSSLLSHFFLKTISFLKLKEEKDAARTVNNQKKKQRKLIVEACQQIADGVSHELGKLEAFDSMKAISLMKILLLLTKFQPILLAKHVTALQPYLAVNNNSQNGIKFVFCVAGMLEEALPVIENPSKTWLARLEIKLVTLMLTKNRCVAHSCLSLLSVVANTITRNYTLVEQACIK